MCMLMTVVTVEIQRSLHNRYVQIHFLFSEPAIGTEYTHIRYAREKSGGWRLAHWRYVPLIMASWMSCWRL